MNKEKLTINCVKYIRQKNNEMWMRLLELALISNPIEARKVIHEIITNDEEIIKNLKQLL